MTSPTPTLSEERLAELKTLLARYQKGAYDACSQPRNGLSLGEEGQLFDGLSRVLAEATARLTIEERKAFTPMTDTSERLSADEQAAEIHAMAKAMLTARDMDGDLVVPHLSSQEAIDLAGAAYHSLRASRATPPINLTYLAEAIEALAFEVWQEGRQTSPGHGGDDITLRGNAWANARPTVAQRIAEVLEMKGDVPSREAVAQALYDAFWKRNVPAGFSVPAFSDQAEAIKNMWRNIAYDAKELDQ